MRSVRILDQERPQRPVDERRRHSEKSSAPVSA
jgi:hypothetical protein